MELRTHRAVDPRLSGRPVRLAEGRAELVLDTLPEMAADATGLVHGGFVFSLADHAAMLAVNEPSVVLGSAEVRFERPVVVGARLTAVAAVEETEGRKRTVRVAVDRGGETVLSGRFLCFVPDRHVLEVQS